MSENTYDNWLREICANCGLTKGSHHAGTAPWPYDYCPDPDARMDWKNGPGTVFAPTNRYKRSPEADEN